MESETPGRDLEEITTLKARLQCHNPCRYRGVAVRAYSRRSMSTEQPTRHALNDDHPYSSSKVAQEIDSSSVLSSYLNDTMNALKCNYRVSS